VLTLVLAAILLIGSALLARRSWIADASPRWMRRLEPALAAAAGLVLTLCSAWMLHGRETHFRREAFLQLAASRTEAIANTLRNLRDTELESLAHFYEDTTTVTPEKFGHFSAYLTKNPAVHSWAWLPAVPAADKARFEAAARAAGMEGFEIWQKDPQGKRVPVAGRDVYYPVFRVAPLVGNERILGYELGSEPLCRAASETAARTGLPTASDPITLLQETGSQKAVVLCRPVFGGADPKRLRGFAVAVVRMVSLLRSTAEDYSALVELSLLRTDAASEPLAASWDAAPVATGLSATRSVLAFGKVFSVTAHAGPEFMRLHPARVGRWVTLAGLLLTAALATVLGALLRRREQLERLVSERTNALRQSEQKLTHAMNQARLAEFEYDVASGLLTFGDRSWALLGTTAELEGGSVITVEAFARKFVRPEDAHLVGDEIAKAVATVDPNYTSQMEMRVVRRDGETRQMLLHISIIKGAAGQTTHIRGANQDITERKKSEQELRNL
jgi:PAS domain S-box-containing protein